MSLKRAQRFLGEEDLASLQCCRGCSTSLVCVGGGVTAGNGRWNMGDGMSTFHFRGAEIVADDDDDDDDGDRFRATDL